MRSLVKRSAVATLLGCLTLGSQAAGEMQAQPEPFVSVTDFHLPGPRLEGLIEALLAQNPRLEAARARYRPRVERVPQARSLPDPMLQLRYFAETPETRVGPQRYGAELSQSFPWAGKRKLDAAGARSGATEHAWRVTGLERELVAELKRKYFEAGYLQEALTVNAEESDLLKRFEYIALRRYSTGKGIQQSVIQVQTDSSRLIDRQVTLRAQLDIVIHDIARLLGRSEVDETFESVRFELLDLDLDRSGFEASVESHPGIRSGQHAVARGEAILRRKQLDKRPDFRLGLGFTSVDRRDDAMAALNPPEDDGQDVWSLSVGFNIPLHRKRTHAAVSEARETAQADRHRLTATRDELRHHVHHAVLRLESIHERARLYEEVIIPQAEQSLGSAETAYTSNRQDFLGLLDVSRALFHVRLTYHRLLADYWIALADLELGLGRRFPAQRGEE